MKPVLKNPKIFLSVQKVGILYKRKSALLLCWYERQNIFKKDPSCKVELACDRRKSKFKVLLLVSFISQDGYRIS